MEYLNPILENHGSLPVVATAAAGLVVLSFFRFLRRMVVILSTIVATPIFFYQQGAFTPHTLGQFEISNEQELWLVLIALTVGLLLGYAMPIGLNGGNRIVPSSIAPFGVYLVIGAIGVFTLNTMRVVMIEPVQEVCVLGFIAGVASGFCFYSFVRFVDAAIPLCGWSLVACLAIVSLYPRLGGSSLLKIDSESLKELGDIDWIDSNGIPELDSYISEYLTDGRLRHSYQSTIGAALDVRERVAELAGSANDQEKDEG